MTNEYFNNLIGIFDKLLPEGEQEMLVGNMKVYVNRNGDDIEVKIETVEDEADKEEVINVVHEFKDAIKELDDCVFVETIEKMDNEEVNKLNTLLDLDKFTKDESEEVVTLMDKFTDLVTETLEEKIVLMERSLKRFNGE